MNTLLHAKSCEFENLCHVNEASNQRIHVTCVLVTFMWNVQCSQTRETETTLVVVEGWGWVQKEVKWGLVTKMYCVSFWVDEELLKLTVVMVTHICEYTKPQKIKHVKWTNLWYKSYSSIKLLYKIIINPPPHTYTLQLTGDLPKIWSSSCREEQHSLVAVSIHLSFSVSFRNNQYQEIICGLWSIYSGWIIS